MVLQSYTPHSEKKTGHSVLHTFARVGRICLYNLDAFQGICYAGSAKLQMTKATFDQSPALCRISQSGDDSSVVDHGSGRIDVESTGYDKGLFVTVSQFIPNIMN